MERLLITGFEAFGGRPANTSWRLAVALAAFAGQGAHALPARRLEVDHVPAARALRRFCLERPSALMMLGEWSGSSFRIERYARPGPLAPWAGGVRPARWPVVPLFRAMRCAALPVRLSEDAGRYVCDTSYWAALSTSVPRVVFVHVPRYWPAARDRSAVQALHQGLVHARNRGPWVSVPAGE
ncbi:MAG: hypothetical protein AAFQ88_11290 [Pseudomonadota bacterium]